MKHPEWWEKKYLQPGEDFIATDFTMKLGQDGTIKAVVGVGVGQLDRRTCHYFGEGNVMVGKKIEPQANGMEAHSPLYLEEATGRLYHVIYVGPGRLHAAKETSL